MKNEKLKNLLSIIMKNEKFKNLSSIINNISR